MKDEFKEIPPLIPLAKITSPHRIETIGTSWNYYEARALRDWLNKALGDSNAALGEPQDATPSKEGPCG